MTLTSGSVIRRYFMFRRVAQFSTTSSTISDTLTDLVDEDLAGPGPFEKMSH